MKEKPEAGPDIMRTLEINQSSEKGKHLRRWIVWGIPILVVGIVLAFLITRNKAESVQFRTQTLNLVILRSL